MLRKYVSNRFAGSRPMVIPLPLTSRQASRRLSTELFHSSFVRPVPVSFPHAPYVTPLKRFPPRSEKSAPDFWRWLIPRFLVASSELVTSVFLSRHVHPTHSSSLSRKAFLTLALSKVSICEGAT